jgi:chromosome partitioning protein
MRTVAILNEKGGSGKTTIATNLACVWQRQGMDTLLVDADPQQSALDWSTLREGPPTTVQVGKGRLDTLSTIKGYDLAIVDGAPRMGTLARDAAQAADLVVVPVQPSALDVWSAEVVIELSKRMGTPACIVVSRQITGTNLAAGVEEALEAFDVPVLKARTAQRVAYAEAIGAGMSVLEVSDAKAEAEVTAIADEILSILSSTQTTPAS